MYDVTRHDTESYAFRPKRDTTQNHMQSDPCDCGCVYCLDLLSIHRMLMVGPLKRADDVGVCVGIVTHPNISNFCHTRPTGGRRSCQARCLAGRETSAAREASGRCTCWLTVGSLACNTCVCDCLRSSMVFFPRRIGFS